MSIYKKYTFSKDLNPEDTIRKLLAVGESYKNFLEIKEDSVISDDVLVGMTFLFHETLCEVEVLLFGEKYFKTSYIEDVKVEDVD